MRKKDLFEIKVAFSILEKALLSENEDQWNAIISESHVMVDKEVSGKLSIAFYGEFIEDNDSNYSELSFLVAEYDNIKITIDASGNHMRAHVHLGTKTDNHSVSIALDNGAILADSKNIPTWKKAKIVDWVMSNKKTLNKMWRCINPPWGDTQSAAKRRSKLLDF